MPAKGTEMRVRRARLWLTALVVGVTMTVLISGVGVPERLVQRAAASVPTPDPGRPVHLLTEPGMGYRFQP